MLKYETDSRKVKPGQTFVAIKGYTVDGHNYILDAIKNGAVSIIAEKEVESSIPVKIVPNSSEYLKEQLVKEYSKELNRLKIIGVTGTNGKTTTCYLTHQLLKSLNVKVAYMGTIGFFFEEEKIELPNTTPEILTIYKLFLDALEKGCTTVVMEVSSHALALERIAGLEFQIGAFTNLTEDHLDYHKTMEEYLQAKLKILNYMAPNSIFIVNQDDIASKRFQEAFKNTKTIGMQASDYWIKEYTFNPVKTNILLEYHNQDYTIETNLTGKFNVYNYLTALAILHEYGFSIDEQIKSILLKDAAKHTKLKMVTQ